MSIKELVNRYCRTDKLPHIWCTGCGNGIVMGAIIRAFDQTDLDQDKTVIVSGIGCSSRAPGYMNFDTLHATMVELWLMLLASSWLDPSSTW